MNGYYFVLTRYFGGRISYSERRFASASEAESQAEIKRKRADVKSAIVEYQAGETAVDIKKFI